MGSDRDAISLPPPPARSCSRHRRGGGGGGGGGGGRGGGCVEAAGDVAAIRAHQRLSSPSPVGQNLAEIRIEGDLHPAAFRFRKFRRWLKRRNASSACRNPALSWLAENTVESCGCHPRAETAAIVVPLRSRPTTSPASRRVPDRQSVTPPRGMAEKEMPQPRAAMIADLDRLSHGLLHPSGRATPEHSHRRRRFRISATPRPRMSRSVRRYRWWPGIMALLETWKRQ